MSDSGTPVPKDEPGTTTKAFPNRAIRLVAEAQLAPESRQAVAEQLLDYARDTAKTDPKGVGAFLDKLTQAAPPDRLGTAWAAKLADLRRQTQSATQPSPGAAAG